MTRRLISALVALALALSIGSIAAPVSASHLINNDSWHFNSSLGENGAWIDNACGTSAQKFKIRLYNDNDLHDRFVTFCHNVSDFDCVPYNSGWQGNCNVTSPFNDRASSWWVQDTGGSGYGVRIYEHAAYSGASRCFNSAYVGDTGNFGSLNDVLSSIQRVVHVPGLCG